MPREHMTQGVSHTEVTKHFTGYDPQSFTQFLFRSRDSDEVTAEMLHKSSNCSRYKPEYEREFWRVT